MNPNTLAPKLLLVWMTCLLLLQPNRLAAAEWSGGAGADLNWSSAANWTNNAPPAAATEHVFFPGGDYPVSTNAAGLVNNVVNNNTTIGTLSYLALTPGSNHTTLINAGRTLSLLGARTNIIGIYTSTIALFVGSGMDSGASAQVYATMTGPGTLSISNPAANVDITQTSGSSGGNKMATLDLGTLNLFNGNVSQVRVGHGNSSGSSGQATFVGNRAAGTLFLAQTNLLVCNSSSYGISVSDNPQNNGPASFLYLGTSNAIFSDFGMVVGRRKSTTQSVLTFAPGVSGTAFFRNKAGTGPMNVWAIGDNSESGAIGTSTSGMLDFSAGTVDARVNSVYVGRGYNGNGTNISTATGVLTFAYGSILVSTNLEVGYQQSLNGANGVGTVNVQYGGLLVVSNDVRLGRLAGTTNGAGSATGTLNLSGTAQVYGNVVDGGGTSTVAIDSGLLDLQPPGDLAAGNLTVDTLTLNSGTVTNAGVIAAGTLTVNAGSVIAGNTILDLRQGNTMDLSGFGGAFPLGSTQTLRGSGTVTGDLTQQGGATLNPGGSGTAGSLNVTGGLTLNQGGNLVFDLSSDPSQVGGANDLITVGGTLTLAGTNNVTLNPTGGSFGLGSYRLISHGGLGGGDGSYFNLSGIIAQSRQTFTFDTSTPGQVNLQVGGSLPTTLRWVGDGLLNLWDYNTTANWLNGSTPDKFHMLDSVVFDDSGAATPEIEIVGVLTPTSVTVSNETKTYTLCGTGHLTGATGLLKQGAGVLRMVSPSNDFTGPVTVAGGILRIATAASSLPTNCAVTLSNTPGVRLELNGYDLALGSLSGGGPSGGDVSLDIGTLSLNGNGGNFGGVISGTGKVVKSGPGTQILSGANLYSGGTIINTGTVTVVNSTGSGTGSGAVAIAGGTLQIGTNGTAGSVGPQPGGVLTNNGALVYNRSDTLTPVEVITGTGTVRHAGSGLLLFNHDNSYTNITTLNNNFGVLRISSPFALGTADGGTIVTGGNTPAPGNSGQLELSGGIVFGPEPLTLGCRGSANFQEGPSQFVNHDGSNTWTGPIDITQGGSWIALQSDSGFMRIQSSIAGGPIATGTRNLILRGVADGEVVGSISNGPVTTTFNFCKKDAGKWTLWGANTYNGLTAISNGTLVVNGSLGGSSVTVYGGTLGGNGTIGSAVTIQPSGTLSPGVSIGTLRLNSHLTNYGNFFFELNKSLGSNDYVIVTGNLVNAGSGTLTVTNLGPGLVAGDHFTLFSKPVVNGGALTIVSAGNVVWTNQLAVDGSIQVLSAPQTVPTDPTNLTWQMSGGKLTLSWPSAYLGWSLQVQTNSATAGLGTNWYTIPGSESMTTATLPLNATDPSVFYRLKYSY